MNWVMTLFVSMAQMQETHCKSASVEATRITNKGLCITKFNKEKSGKGIYRFLR